MNQGHPRAGRSRHAAFAALIACAIPFQVADARNLPPVDALAMLPATAHAVPSAAANALRKAAPLQSIDPVAGVPTFLWGEDAAKAPATNARAANAKAGLDAEASARAWLADLADVYRLSAAEIATLPMHSLQRFPDGAAIVRFRNTIDGVEVFREEANVLLDRSGALVAIGGFVSGAPAAAQRSAAVTLTAQEAAAAALADFGFARDAAVAFTDSPAEGGYRWLALPAEARSADGARLARPARTKPVWFRLGAELVPAHYIEVAVRDDGARRTDHYAYVVAATDGTILYRHNQASHVAFSYRVFAEPTAPYLPYPTPAGRNGFPHPTATPDGYQPPPLAPNLVTLQNLPFSRNDPWLPPTATKTVGNNVEAYADLVAPDLFGPAATNECSPVGALDGDLHACTTSANTFDHPYDFNQFPDASRAQVTAGVTHLFYLINYFHDWFYDAGFDEASGNAQTDNFGRGGLGNDNIVAVTQDYNDIDNAYMDTPSDGLHPELHMFLWVNDAVLTKVTAPASIAGVKTAGIADFGALTFDLTADVALAQDAANTAGPSTTDGCTTITNAAAMVGRIALIDRGTCTFVIKVKNAQDAGAIGVVIANNSSGIVNMTGDDPTITIPVVSVSQSDGAALKAQLAAPTRVTMRLAYSFALRDGAIDSMVAAHEWGHYISNRLIGNANGLDANQAGGIGEGWGDFHEMIILVKDADRQIPSNANFNGTYSSNAYPLGGPDFPPDVLNNAYYYGDRRYPYTRDMTKNPLTFKHISASATLPAAPKPSLAFASSDNSEVHNTGEVWGSMLWECYSNLLNDTGRLTFAQAQDRMKRYLVGAYKVTPVNPTFVTARDALLAVMQAQDPKDRDLCLHGFAKRGAGLGAVAPPAFSLDNGGVVESYKTVLPAGGLRTVAIEYYNAGFDHYFVTSIADEITKLDNGTFVGWARTGESFPVYSDAPAGTAPVCRFFSTAFGPKSSHFYTPDVGECGIVKLNASWQFESPSVFAVLAPGPAGDCPSGSNPVYRLYNNGQGGAPNHRYTTSLATRTTMLGKGWIPEGYGALGVIMCSPA
jgi:hypothetical protein